MKDEFYVAHAAMGSGKGNMELVCVRENREVRFNAWTHWAAQQDEA